MKTIKAFLPLPLLTFLISLTLSGCYTQLALFSEKEDSTVESLQAIPNQPVDVSVYAPVPYYYQPIAPAVNLLPTASSASNENVTQTQPRETGYQRSDQSGTTESTNSTSNNRTSGSTRGGR
jgi:hypothetical protein